MLKKLLAIAGIATVTLGLGLGSSAVYNAGDRSAEDVVLIGIDEIQGGYAERRTGSQNPKESSLEAICLDGFNKGLCNAKDPSRWAYASDILPICETAKQEDCLEGFSMFDSEGNKLKAEFIRNIAGPDFPADPKLGLSKGSTHSLWRVPGAVNAGGTETYAVAVTATKTYEAKEARFVTGRFGGIVMPYVQTTGPQYELVKYGISVLPDGSQSAGYSGGGGGQGCAWAEDGICGLKEDFGAVKGVSLVIRMSTDVSGWFNGRLENPSLSIEPISETNVLIKVSASAVEVPRFLARFPKAELTTDYEKKLRVEARGAGGVGGQGLSPYFGVIPGSQTAINWISRYRNLVNDMADGVSTIWSFGSTFFKSNNKCLDDSSQVLGLVTTNASAFNDGPPVFENGYLSYGVAGLHFAHDGETLNLGSYDLVMRTDVARCLYGFGKAPVSATVQVLSDKGVDVVASTTVAEKEGWLQLAASNFTFSEKEIRVKVTQPYSKTLTTFTGTTKSLSAKQKAEIKTTVTKAKSNPKFICTGVYVNASSKAMALARARAACNYAKSLDKNHSYFAQAKQTGAKSFDGKVMLVSK